MERDKRTTRRKPDQAQRCCKPQHPLPRAQPVARSHEIERAEDGNDVYSQGPDEVRCVCVAAQAAETGD